MTRFERFQAEMAAGGSVGGNTLPERPSVATMVLGLGAWAALFIALGLLNPWTLVFVVGVLVSVLLHEVGHFWTARRSGMHVTQFFMGFGPRVWSIHRDGVEYGVRAIPLGAFVRIIGMNSLDEVPAEDEDRTYRQATFPRRMLVITAGSLMHLLVAVVTIVAVYSVAGRVEEAGRVTIYGVGTGTPAAAAGLRAGDIVTSADGVPIADATTFRAILGRTAPGTSIEIILQRGSDAIVTAATLVQSESAPEGEVRGFLGVQSDSFERVEQSLGSALVEGPADLVAGLGQATVGILKVLNPVNVFGHLVGTNDDPSSRPTTLVGAARMSDDYAASDGWAGLLSLLAALNVSVGVFNMFPLLPLDGGHAAIAVYERLRQRGGRRYFADVSRLMPLVTVTVALLAFMFLTGLYLDTMAG